jgi:hypothetical protein
LLDFKGYLDQENDDLDPDFFDFTAYTSVPLSRLFFGFSRDPSSGLIASDPRLFFDNTLNFTSFHSSTQNYIKSNSSLIVISKLDNSLPKFNILKMFTNFFFTFFLSFFV